MYKKFSIPYTEVAKLTKLLANLCFGAAICGKIKYLIPVLDVTGFRYQASWRVALEKR